MMDALDSLIDNITPPAEPVYEEPVNAPANPTEAQLRKQLETAMMIQEELVKRDRTNLIDKYYPTPENRTKYPIHIECFHQGRHYRERLMLAANRIGKCITANTVIETQNGNILVKDLFASGQRFGVWAWDGKKKVRANAHPVFKKVGLHQCYRVEMSDGRSFECADHHRVLTTSGWQLFEDLLGSLPIHQESNSASYPAIHVASARRWLETQLGYLDRYFAGFRQRGERLLRDANIDQEFVPLLAGVRQQDFSSFDLDVPDSRCANTVQSIDAHLSIRGGLRRCADQFVASLDRTAGTIARLLFGQNPAVCQSQAESVSRLQSCDGPEFHTDDTVRGAYPLLVDGNRIVSVIPIGLQEVFDFTVDTYHNYITAGWVHHNTQGVLCYEVACHATGLYPQWWTGHRYTQNPKVIWLGGDTGTTVRDILQSKLLGPEGAHGTGMIRGSHLLGTTPRRGIPDAVESIRVRWRAGNDTCVIMLKTYDQGREAWQGTEVAFIGLDEEPPPDIYTEALLRTMTVEGGRLLSTYTPVNGMTEVTTGFLDGDVPSKWYCTATWDDVGHLTEAIKKELLASIPIHQRQARAKGIPTIGVGAIYPVDLESLLIEPFPIPKHWPRGYALDVGWNRTAALWAAMDRESDIMYCYSEYYQGEQSPAVHASAIKRRGTMVGLIDPASRGRSQIDGQRLFEMYMQEGLKLIPANNAVESGIFAVYERMTEGRLKVFNTLKALQKEIPLYHRDKNGQVVKKNDHLLDALRYLANGHLNITHGAAVEGHYATTPSGTRYLTSMPGRRYRSH